MFEKRNAVSPPQVAAPPKKQGAVLCLRVWLIVFLLLPGTTNPQAKPESQYGFLFISSADPDQPGIASMIAQARSDIQDTFDVAVHFDVEYLDPQLLGGGPATDSHTAEFFTIKYSRQKFNVIIAIGPEALHFVKEHGAATFPGAKIVSVGFDHRPAGAKASSSPISTSLYVAPDFKPTIDVALAQNPGTREVVLVAGCSSEDQLELQRARDNLATYSSQIKLTPLTDGQYYEFVDKLSKLDLHSIVLFIDFTADKSGEEYISTRALRDFSRVANRPVYGVFREQVGTGIVGGSVIDMREVGHSLARAAIQLLHGPRARDGFFADPSQQHYVFDGRQLARWRIDRVPAGSTVLYNQPSAWEQYKWRFIWLILAALVEALLIAYLLKATARRKQIEDQLIRSLAVKKLESSLAAGLLHLPDDQVRSEISRGFDQFISCFGIDCISLYELEPETSCFHLLFYRTTPGCQLRLAHLKPSEFEHTSGKLLRGDSVVVDAFAEIAEEGSKAMSDLKKSGVRSYAGIPLPGHRAVVGALFFSSSSERTWDDAMLRELQLIAHIIGSGLERARTHASLSRSEQLKSTILASLPSRVVVIGRDGKIIALNCPSIILPAPADSLPATLQLGTDYLGLWHIAADQNLKQAQVGLEGLQGVLSRKSNRFEMEYSWGTSPRELWTQISVVPLSGTHEGVVVTHSDVTERKLVELERKGLEAARAELSGKLLRAQEQERATIARELHDDINQKLGLLAIDIQTVQHKFPQLEQTVHSELDQLFLTTNRISRDVQQLSHQLHSSRLDHLGLSAAVRNLCEGFSTQYHIGIEPLIENMPRGLPRETGLCLFRVTQECLANIAKHSSATHVRLELRALQDAIYLHVSDDGRGFNVAAQELRDEPGLGLVSMRERLRLVNGELSIHSQEGTGTEITASVPLETEYRAPGAQKAKLSA